MIGKRGPAIWAMVILLILSLSVWAAGQRRNQQQQQQQQQPQQQAQGQGQQQIGPQAKNKDEADAFNSLVMEQNPANKVALAEAFVAKFPDSEFISYAHTFRVTAYSQLGKNKESAAAAVHAAWLHEAAGDDRRDGAEADDTLAAEPSLRGCLRE